jgi:hypothetical protein
MCIAKTVGHLHFASTALKNYLPLVRNSISLKYVLSAMKEPLVYVKLASRMDRLPTKEEGAMQVRKEDKGTTSTTRRLTLNKEETVMHMDTLQMREGNNLIFKGHHSLPMSNSKTA